MSLILVKRIFKIYAEPSQLKPNVKLIQIVDGTSHLHKNQWNVHISLFGIEIFLKDQFAKPYQLSIYAIEKLMPKKK